MARLGVFNFITLNGFYKGPDGDISWHRHGSEENSYSEENLRTDNILLFGRVTYEMMKSYWPTPMAKEANPVVAEGMNRAEKIVFSRTLEKAEWNNSRIIKDNIVDEVRKLKNDSAKNMVILGSGTILSQFADAGLVDEYQVMLDPVALANGTPIFNGIRQKLDLELTGVRTFKSGVVLLSYRPLK